MSLARQHSRVLAAAAVLATAASVGIPSAASAAAPVRTSATVPAAHAAAPTAYAAAAAATSATAITARSSRVGLSATAHISRGQRARVKVVPAPSHVGMRARVQALLSGRWVTLADSRITSTTPKRYTLRTGTTVRLRAQVVTTSGRVVSTSRVQTVVVGR